MSCAVRSGVAGAIGGTSWRQRRLLVLCYHGVSKHDEHLWSDLYVSPAHLRSRLQQLARSRCTVLPLDDAVTRLQAGTLPPRTVALTFDDGAHDFLTAAYPLLREFGTPATLYVTSHYTAHRLPPFEPMSSYLLWTARGKRATLRGILGETADGEVPLDAARRGALHSRLCRFVAEAGMDTGARQAALESLAGALGVDVAPLLADRILQLMSVEEMRSLDASLVELGLHTHHHVISPDPIEFAGSLAENRRVLDAVRPARRSRREHFCYPSGRHSPGAVAVLRSEGIASATTCDPGLATPHDDHLLLPRVIDTMSMTGDTFEAWLQGAAEVVARPRRGPGAA